MEATSFRVLTLAVLYFFQFTSGAHYTGEKNGASQGTFVFAKFFQSHMVLQKEPAKANIYGFSSGVGETVNAQLVTPSSVYTYTVTVQSEAGSSNGTWLIELDPQNADTPANISVTSQGITLTLTDVIFGDVWICSGQSNMQFPVTNMFDAAAEKADVNYPNIRLFTVADKESTTPLDDIIDIWQWWTSPDSNAVSGFSAVCWVYGKNIHKALGHSIGLIHSSWGGTVIEAWSSPEALAKCGMGKRMPESAKQRPSDHRRPPGDHKRPPSDHRRPPSDHKRPPSDHRRPPVDHKQPPIDYKQIAMDYEQGLEQPNDNSVLWNGMIHPFLKMAIKGVIWYQGESDADGGIKMNHYNCTFPTMISDWRQNFNQASNKQTDASFPFGFVQLAPYNNNPAATVGFTDIRWHQTADHGFAPNQDLPNTFMSVAIDLPDFDSPQGSIHPRYKKEVGDRLSLGGLAIAYGKQEVFQGPYPSKAETTGSGFKITYGSSSTLEIRSSSGFELLCSNTWTASNIQASDLTSVTIENVCSSGSRLEAVRYAWRESPCSLKACAVYEKVNGLPAPPFILNVATDRRGVSYIDFHNPVVSGVNPKLMTKSHKRDRGDQGFLNRGFHTRRGTK